MAGIFGTYFNDITANFKGSYPTAMSSRSLTSPQGGHRLTISTDKGPKEENCISHLKELL
jgi:hypothetical protein